jgi:DNA-directed RNA polymerase specialized sigma24 family protein
MRGDDDIVQATATAVYRHWRRARAAGNTDAYVHRMLVRKYLDEKRVGWARVQLMPAPPDLAVADSRQLPRSADVEARDELRTALSELPRAQHAVLVLRYACDRSGGSGPSHESVPLMVCLGG